MPSFENPNHKSQKEEEPSLDKALQSAETSIREAASPEEEKRMQNLKIFETENPEVLEQVMDKVQDIGAQGVAFSTLLSFNLLEKWSLRQEALFQRKPDFDDALPRLEQILKNGLSRLLVSQGPDNSIWFRDWQNSRNSVEYRASLKEQRNDGYYQPVFLISLVDFLTTIQERGLLITPSLRTF